MAKDITNREAVEMMQRASAEIKRLRAWIDFIQPKADAYDLVTEIVGLLPKKSVGMAEDVGYMLDKRAEELKTLIVSGPAAVPTGNME